MIYINGHYLNPQHIIHLFPFEDKKGFCIKMDIVGMGEVNFLFPSQEDRDRKLNHIINTMDEKLFGR